MNVKILFLIIAISFSGVAEVAAQNYHRYERKKERNERNRPKRTKSKDRHNEFNKLKYSCTPMSEVDFLNALSTIKNTSFDDTKLKIATDITVANCLSSEQILAIVKVFSFEANKLSYAKLAYAYCADTSNYFKIYYAFSFSSSKEELSNYISSR